jgi:hypothetical protein
MAEIRPKLVIVYKEVLSKELFKRDGLQEEFGTFENYLEFLSESDPAIMKELRENEYNYIIRKMFLNLDPLFVPELTLTHFNMGFMNTQYSFRYIDILKVDIYFPKNSTQLYAAEMELMSNLEERIKKPVHLDSFIKRNEYEKEIKIWDELEKLNKKKKSFYHE